VGAISPVFVSNHCFPFHWPLHKHVGHSRFRAPRIKPGRFHFRKIREGSGKSLWRPFGKVFRTERAPPPVVDDPAAVHELDHFQGSRPAEPDLILADED